MKFTFSPRRIAQTLSLIVLCLTLASIAGQFSKNYFDQPNVSKFARLFNLDEESNIPTWYSSSTLLLCSVLLAAITCVKKREGNRFVLHWRALSLIFLYISLDETALIHERASNLLERAFATSGFLYYAWIIPATPIMLIFVLAYFRFLLDLPAKTRRLFLFAGSLFVGGALGMEPFEALQEDVYGKESTTFAVMTHIEEVLEMTGIIVFIYALTSYMISPAKEVNVSMNWSEVAHKELGSKTHFDEIQSHCQSVTRPR